MMVWRTGKARGVRNDELLCRRGKGAVKCDGERLEEKRDEGGGREGGGDRCLS